VNIGRKRFPNGTAFRFHREDGWHLVGRMENGKISLCKALQEGKEGDTARLIFVDAEEIVQWNPELFGV
jgi:predicted AAA+ superfamily ATPase